ncbi:hypothetical protein SADUNF_Sadunf14G0086600 [Salix dunnii]|uniref:Uncharacterized protein n=1 Tax=Salix dunnii TaxID=1413687 RepID=A0A835MTP4_9ROSI|nr:hypothetical protein SADUNF_Sadunf14G0086600 [Salix dunnii]
MASLALLLKALVIRCHQDDLFPKEMEESNGKTGHSMREHGPETRFSTGQRNCESEDGKSVHRWKISESCTWA